MLAVPALLTRFKSYFEGITTEPDLHAVKLAAKLIQRESGRFQPAKMPDQFAAAVREMIQAKVENRAPEVIVETEGKPEPAVINIMDALKESMQAKGRSKVREALRKRAGKRLSDEVGKPRSPVADQACAEPYITLKRKNSATAIAPPSGVFVHAPAGKSHRHGPARLA